MTFVTCVILWFFARLDNRILEIYPEKEAFKNLYITLMHVLVTGSDEPKIKFGRLFLSLLM